MQRFNDFILCGLLIQSFSCILHHIIRNHICLLTYAYLMLFLIIDYFHTLSKGILNYLPDQLFMHVYVWVLHFNQLYKIFLHMCLIFYALALQFLSNLFVSEFLSFCEFFNFYHPVEFDLKLPL